MPGDVGSGGRAGSIELPSYAKLEEQAAAFLLANETDSSKLPLSADGAARAIVKPASIHAYDAPGLMREICLVFEHLPDGQALLAHLTERLVKEAISVHIQAEMGDEYPQLMARRYGNTAEVH